eukprot:CAMPEP_0194314810 /NCGR_PEP_ID=MMETSP0171-20130528/11622_1 /TAXON_ID=218684 /ORGANISM="Corethron pennatum, Strain L29A3" /LENGTH=684 /DNA_ID=CAMNT_0039070369 /DNA_START=213 /DNA_END=2268 /DNA_ORIENTATION=+
MWAQRHIFIATAAAVVGVASGQVCQKGCTKWFDGCNTCRCDADGKPIECTEMSCEKKKKPQCLDKVVDVCPATCSSWFDGCNNCNCEAVGMVGKECSKKSCLVFEKPMCNTYDCNTKEVWTKEKTAWCCESEDKGCKYDCNTKEMWPEEKTAWCCEVKKKGCLLCPVGCAKWFDGCNTCRCNENREPVDCTDMDCKEKEKPRCLDKVVDVCPATCSSWFDGCNECNCEAVGVVGTDCTEKNCKVYLDPMCNKYDCNTREIWTEDKKEWCCKFEKKGCEYDCDTKEMWTPEKAAWCCKSEKKGCPEAPDVYITFPELGLGEVVETDKKDQENFKAQLKEMKQTVPEWLKKRTNKPPKLLKKFKCRTKEAELANCDVDAGETCLRMKVRAPPDKDGDSDSADSGTRRLQAKSKYKPWCLKPCAKVCTGISLKCGQLAEDPPAYPIWWSNFENRPCFQMEQKQGKKKYFMRWSCRCPDRDYTVSEACDPNAGAFLSNCVRAWIVQAPEINFQDLSSVQLGYVRSTEKDIDFQGKVDKSIFCRIDAHEDVEIGGGECPANLQHNVFFNTVMKKDFQFEEGATMQNNILFNVEVGDDLEIKDEPGTYTTTIVNNLFGHVQVPDDCKIATGVGPVTITGTTAPPSPTRAAAAAAATCPGPPLASPACNDPMAVRRGALGHHEIEDGLCSR